MIESNLLCAVNTARILGIFKTFCESNNSADSKRRIRNIISLSQNKEFSIKEIILREQGIELKPDEACRMVELIFAYLNKNCYRRPIEKGLKNQLLISQKNKCAICNKPIDSSAHADHIVPFKYVGDCLNDNWQLLCQHCNEAKNESLDYQIRFLLKTI